MISRQCLFCCSFIPWTLCPEVSSYHFYYLRKYLCNSHYHNNATYQTTNYTVKCKYTHASGNSKILWYQIQTHFPDTVRASHQYPVKEIIKPFCFAAYRITGNRPECQNNPPEPLSQTIPFHAIPPPYISCCTSC